MALTPLWCDGAEHGRAISTNTGPNAGIAGSITNPGASPGTNVVSGGAYGNYAYRCIWTSGGGAGINRSVPGTPNKFQFFFRFKVVLNPSTNAFNIGGFNCTSAGGTNVPKLGLNTDGTIRLRPNGSSATGEQTGPNVNDGAWHTVEVQADISANPWTLDWWVDGVAQTQATRAVAADTVTNVVLGSATTPTESYTVDFDDWIYGTWTSAGEKWGNVKILALSPGSDGTHSVSTAGFAVGDTSTTNKTNGSTDVYQSLDTYPLSLTRSTTDNISCRTHANGAYLEVKNVAASSSEATALAVTCWGVYSSPTTSANSGSAAVVRTSAGSDNEITGMGNFTSGVDYSETTNFMKSVLVPNPSSWTKTELDAIRIRIGRDSTNTDVSPRPTWQGFVTQVAYPIATTVNGTAAISVPHSLVVSGRRTVYGSSVATPVDTLVVAGRRTVLGSALLAISGKYAGIAAYSMNFISSVHAWRQHFTATPLQEYTFSFYAKRGTATDAKLSVYDWSNFQEIVAPTSYYADINTTDYERVSVTFTAPSGCTDCAVYLSRDSGSTGTVLVAAAQVEEGDTATSWERTTGSAGSVNLLQQSENLANSPWTTFDPGQIALSATTNMAAANVVLHALALRSVSSGPSEVFGTAALAAIDALAAAGVRTVYAAALLSGTDAMLVSGRRSVSGTSTLASPSSLLVAGRRTVLGSAALPTTDTLQVLGVRKVLGSSGFAIVDALTVDGHVVQVVTGVAALSGGGTLSVQGDVIAVIAGSAAFLLAGTLSARGEATLHPPLLAIGKPSHATQLTRTGFQYPMESIAGEVIYMVKQYVNPTTFERRAIDIHGTEWRVVDQGLVEPV